MRLSGLIFVFVLIELPVFAQHIPIYSQYLFNGLALNPAYAGVNDAMSFSLSHRNQWSGIEGAPITTTASAHGVLKNEKIGLGLLVYNDKLGINSNTAINANYAYRINTGYFKLAFGLQAGAVFNSQKWSETETTKGFDDAIPGNSVNIRPTIGSGVYLNTSKFFVGLSAPQLLSSQSSSLGKSTSYKSYLLSMGYSFLLISNLEFKPSILLKYLKNSAVQTDFNSMFTYKKFISAGFSYRTKNALVFLFRSELTDQLHIAYSYDHFTGKVGNYGKGAHEFMLDYVLTYKLKVKGTRSF